MSKKILVIEDDSILQDALREALEIEGFTVLQALEGITGKKMVKEIQPDLIILDLILPGEDGYHFLCDLNEDEKTKNIPIIVLTVVESETSSEECKAYGAVDYLVKSENTIQDILKKVKTYAK